MEIGEACALISDVNVNEEPHPQVPVMAFTVDEELQAKSSKRRKISPGNKPLDIC